MFKIRFIQNILFTTLQHIMRYIQIKVPVQIFPASVNEFIPDHYILAYRSVCVFGNKKEIYFYTMTESQNWQIIDRFYHDRDIAKRLGFHMEKVYVHPYCPYLIPLIDSKQILRNFECSYIANDSKEIAVEQ